MENIIETDGMSKRFGKLIAVDSVCLTVKKKEIDGARGLTERARQPLFECFPA